MHSVLAVGFVPRVGASPAWRYSAHARDACLLEFELMLGQVLYEDGRSVFGSFLFLSANVISLSYIEHHIDKEKRKICIFIIFQCI